MMGFTSFHPSYSTKDTQRRAGRIPNKVTNALGAAKNAAFGTAIDLVDGKPFRGQGGGKSTADINEQWQAQQNEKAAKTIEEQQKTNAFLEEITKKPAITYSPLSTPSVSGSDS